MYTLLIWMVSLALKVAALWNEKIRLFVDGRKKLFSRIEAAVKGYDDIIWFHVASMGEFEEARPVMEEIRRRFPERKILLTIFSPTGYTHSIVNLGDTDLITFIWCNECFDPNRPDTYFEEV